MPAFGNHAPRPHAPFTPPPDAAEAIYYEGMAAYQHRYWRQALEKFSRLKELQPTRPGLDPLIEEVRWFLQLQETTPSPSNAGHLSNTGPNWAERQSGLSRSQSGPTAAEWAASLRSPFRWQTFGIVLLALVGVTALLLYAFQDRLPWVNAADRQVREVLDRGQARLGVGDYEGAEAAFRQVLAEDPGHAEAKAGLARAARMRTLAQGYAAAEAAIAVEDWEAAAAELAKISAVDRSYADVQAKSDFVAQRQRLAALYAEGTRLYDLGRWPEAIAQFENIRQLDSAYRGEAVSEFLFVSYLSAGDGLIAAEGADLVPVGQAVEYYSRALAIHPRNRLATDALRLGRLFLDALKAADAGRSEDARSLLQTLLGEAPQYAEGQAAGKLYDLILSQADDALQTGQIASAIEFYRQAQGVPVADLSRAIRGEAIARAVTPTPTPRPTATLTTTPPPAPSAVARQGGTTLRAGPGTAFATVGALQAGARVGVTGRSPDGSWLRVCCVAGGKDGWVAASVVVVEGELAAVETVAPPRAPTASAPRPRPTASATPSVPKLTCVEGKVRDVAGGAPLAGWQVAIAGQGAALNRRTDSQGSYRFVDLAPGAYAVTEQLESGWRAVSPQEAGVTIAPAGACVTVDFWNERAAADNAQPTPPR